MNVSSACMFGLSRHPVSRFCQHANPALVNSHVVYSCLDRFRFFPHENVCQPSSLQSKLRSIRTRLSRLQTVIDGQESRRALDKMSKRHRSRLDTSFCTRTVGILTVGLRRNLVEDSMSGNRVTLQTNTEPVSVARDVLFAHISFPGTLLG